MQDTEPRAEPASTMHAEFDQLADDYHRQHQANIAITGEAPEYFSEYKIADLARRVAEAGLPSAAVLDFGSGIGNSIPFFRKHFASSALSCADVSARSMEISRTRFPGNEHYVQIVEDGIPLDDGSQDIVFSACVFHHIPHEQHDRWLRELKRITRPGGLLAIYEHNPLNPLTVRAVNTCPLDVNAKLIAARTMRARAERAGWSAAETDYKLFFPHALAGLRPLERHLGWCGLGAQYRMSARRDE